MYISLSQDNGKNQFGPFFDKYRKKTAVSFILLLLLKGFCLQINKNEDKKVRCDWVKFIVSFPFVIKYFMQIADCDM
jgi:hypothetical protein